MLYSKSRSCLPPSPPFVLPPEPYRQARTLKDGIVNYGKAGYKVVETMERIHKGQTRCMSREERVMWTALFFPLDFNEVA